MHKSYPFQKAFDNQNLFRPLIFKKYHPDWNKKYWKDLEHLVDQYEKIESQGSSRNVSLRPGDIVKVMTLLEKRCTRAEMNKIETMVRMGRVKPEMEKAFGVEYRKAYPVALKKARADFSRSDFQSSWEFFAIKFGLVPRSTPYKKRLRGKLVVTKDRIFVRPHRAR